jgi:hypothetical protein
MQRKKLVEHAFLPSTSAVENLAEAGSKNGVYAQTNLLYGQQIVDRL